MRLSELQRKDIININDGKKIGRIIDVEMDQTTGNLINILIEANKNIKTFFSGEKDILIKYTQISKIGEDVILIDLNKND